MILKLVPLTVKMLKHLLVKFDRYVKTSEVVFLQETWLMDFDNPLLNNISEDFYGKGVSSMDASSCILNGRPFGGLGILWKKSLDKQCNIVSFNDPRLLGIEYTTQNGIKILFVNVYLPYDNSDNAVNTCLNVTKYMSLTKPHMCIS